MDIENNYEQELVFKIEIKNKEEKHGHKQRKIYKMASENLTKMVIDRLEGKTGDC